MNRASIGGPIVAAGLLALISAEGPAAEASPVMFAQTGSVNVLLHHSILELTTPSGVVAFDATSRGTYRTDGGSTGTDPLNSYLVGLCAANENCGYPQPERRDWFRFTIPNTSILAASLRLDNPTIGLSPGFLSANLTETYNLWDVTTAFSMPGRFGSTQIFDDLGAGTLFGSRIVSAADNDRGGAHRHGSHGRRARGRP